MKKKTSDLNKQESLKESIVADLSKGQWVTSLMAPILKYQLVQRFDPHHGSHLSLGSLTRGYYEKLSPDQINGWDLDKMTIPQWQDSVNRLIDEQSTKVVGLEKQNCISSENLSRALRLIRRMDGKLFEEIEKWITHYCLVESDCFRSASHPYYFGVIFLNVDRSVEDLAIAIVHEFAHQELFLINLLDRLVLGDADYRLAHAPFQKKMRPPIGRLHAAHALFRMAQFAEKIFYPSRMKIRLLLQDTLKTFQSNELTAFGEDLLFEVYPTMVFGDQLKHKSDSMFELNSLSALQEIAYAY